MKYFGLLFPSVIGFVLCIEHDLKGFDDSIQFGINWPGDQENLENLVEGKSKEPQVNTKNNEILKVTTADKESYECQIPLVTVEETTKFEEYDGPSPLNLLRPLFQQKICSFRLESYWSYEVCHGRYIRQYHEEREGKQSNVQQYFLGHWSVDKQMKLEEVLKGSFNSKDSLKTVKVDGNAVPYVELAMTDGTVCDLSGKPRLTRVRYVCFIHGKHDVYSFKETSTCEYEIIILSPLLCEHPLFKTKEVGENIINCLPVRDAPKKPRSLLKNEVDSLRFHHQTIRLNEQEPKDVLAVLKVEKIEKDGETHLKFELHPITDDETLTESAKPPQLPDKSSVKPVNDDSPVRAFLDGDYCLRGGTGWWKYEFCYGTHVVQYHVDRAGQKTSLVLGKYEAQAHFDWINENKGKAPKPGEQRTSISHFYSNGDICDKTGKPRQTEVKLKCLEKAVSQSQVTLYLLEPRTCHYILGVESPLICDLLPLADEYGLIKPSKPFKPFIVPKDPVQVEKKETVQVEKKEPVQVEKKETVQVEKKETVQVEKKEFVYRLDELMVDD